MIHIRPFSALRANDELAPEVAALPYDVCNVEEARKFKAKPYHFYHVTRAEIDLPDNVDVHSQQVYDQALVNLNRFVQEGTLIQDQQPAYFIYRLEMNGRGQTGLLCASSVKDYNEGRIKKHEFTRPEKEKDRIDHMHTLGAQTGVVFLAYRDVDSFNDLVQKITTTEKPLYDFQAEDGVMHTVWAVYDAGRVADITNIFAEQVPATYIADGHHRAASAAKVAQMNADNEGAQYFLTCLFPESQLQILDYNRVVKDLNGLTSDEFLKKLSEHFEVSEAARSPMKPSAPQEFGMYLQGKWYRLKAKAGSFDAAHPIRSLDVQILQDNVLTALLNINDPRVDTRVEFVGGIRGLAELERRVDSGEMVAAFACYPVSLAQLFAVADSGEVMPPKSTWFEPKTRDGLVTYLFDKK